MDPSFLSELLRLPGKSNSRPAKLIGYYMKLWGQYPAIVDGPSGAIIEGMVLEIESEKHGVRLAEYETDASTTTICRIRFTEHVVQLEGVPILVPTDINVDDDIVHQPSLIPCARTTGSMPPDSNSISLLEYHAHSTP